MWYRKLMEHFYYTFLLRDLTEEWYHLYKLYREYNLYRERAQACKSLYKVQDQENIYLCVLAKKLELISELEKESGRLLVHILKEPNKWIGLGNLATSPFISPEKLHIKVFDGASPEERRVLWWKDYQTLYWLVSYEVHSNPIQRGMLTDDDFRRFINLDGLLDGMICFICRNMGLKLSFDSWCTQDEYDKGFVKDFRPGDEVCIPSIIKGPLKIIEKIPPTESQWYALYVVESGDKKYTVPAVELYPHAIENSSKQEGS